MNDLTKEQEEEITKCYNSRAYFYNNYFLIDGKKPTVQLTDEQFEEIDRQAKLMMIRARGRWGRGIGYFGTEMISNETNSL
jgi:hypothetical protein